MMVDLSKVDVKLLTKQRETLRSVIDSYDNNTADDLEGINNLLDYIHDQLVCENCNQPKDQPAPHWCGQVTR